MKKNENKDLVGVYVDIYQNPQGELLYPSVKGIVVKVSPSLLTVQTEDDFIWKIKPSALIPPKQAVDSSISKFLRNFSEFVKQNWEEERRFKPLTFSWFKELESSLKKHKRVRHFYITDSGGVVVITENLKALDYDWKKTNIKIGKMAIKLFFDRWGEFKLQIRNLDWEYTEDGQFTNHPHVDSCHGVCLGEAREDFDRSIYRGDLYTAISVLIEMLTQFDLSDSEYTNWISDRIPRRKQLHRSFLEKTILFI